MLKRVQQVLKDIIWRNAIGTVLPIAALLTLLVASTWRGYTVALVLSVLAIPFNRE